MKTSLYRIFDEADAAELAPFLQKNDAPTVSSETLAAVRLRVFAKTGLAEPQKKRSYFRLPQLWAATAACLCITVGVLFAAGVLPVGVRPVPDVSDPDISYYSIEDLLSRDDYGSIIWGQQQDKSDTILPDEDSQQSEVGSQVGGSTVQRDGLIVSAELNELLSTLPADTQIAIGVSSLAQPSHRLAEHVYQGRTYLQIRNDYQHLRSLLTDLMELKRFSDNYEPFEAEDDAFIFWEKLYSAVDDALVAKYFDGEKIGGSFDVTAISDDLSACETEINRLENDLAACRRDWTAECMELPSLERLKTEKGYYVAGNAGTYAVIVPVGSFQAFAADVQALFEQQLLQNIVFRLATHDELGMEKTEQSTAFQPGSDETEIPNYPDDVTVETTPVFAG